MRRSWTIGSSPDCDLVVDLPTVSAHHCRLTRDADGFLLEDLGSTNGTFVNGERCGAPARVSRDDSITLGRTLRMPWPPKEARPEPGAVRIGREPDNDLVVDLPTVSGYHARVFREGASGEALIEDLGSTNGTALGSPDRKITRSPLSASDTIYLGSHPIPAAQVLARLGPAPVAPGAVSDAPGGRSEPWWSAWPRRLTPIWGPSWRLAALLAQAPVTAGVIVWALGAGAGSARGRAAALFWLGLAAVWFGLSDAVLGGAPGAARPRGGRPTGGAARLIPRFAVLGALCGLQCVSAWAVVAHGAGLRGPALPALALLVLAAAVGLALGLVLIELSPRPAIALAVLPLAVLPQWLLGGEVWPLPRMAPWARAGAQALPSRWAFEGLLLLESARHPAGGDDLAERYFPAETERMGVRADVTALGAMLIGLAALAAFLAGNPKPEG